MTGCYRRGRSGAGIAAKGFGGSGGEGVVKLGSKRVRYKSGGG